MKTKEIIKYKNMTDYKPNECGFAIMYYENVWSWIVLPLEIIETESYEYKNIKCTLVELLPHNLYTHKLKDNATPDEVATELLKKELNYSDKLTNIMNETGYEVFWFH